MSLDSLLGVADNLPSYPVHTWHPARQDSIDIHIRADGRWWHEGSEIKRVKLVQLFSRLLAFRAGNYWLVTPTEMLKIKVDDTPFLLTYGQCNTHGVWEFATAYGHQVSLQEQPQWRWFQRAKTTTDVPRPQVHIRDELWAGLSRQVYYELAVAAHTQVFEQQPHACITSNQQTFVLGAIDD